MRFQQIVSIVSILMLGASLVITGCSPAPSTTTSDGSPQDSAVAPGASSGTTEGGATVAPVPAAVGGSLVELELALPAPAFRGTPKPTTEPNVAAALGKARPNILVPSGTVNLAAGRPVSCSDPAPSAGETDYVTDGDKEASDFGYLQMRPGTQWVQIDLGRRATIYAVVVWHNHAEARVYRDVILQISDDPDFLDAVTVFNNDYDNTSGLGMGSEMGYVETSEGKLIECLGHEGRYVRLLSRGNHMGPKNHYTEVEVHGRPLQ